VGLAAPFQLGGWHRTLGLSAAQSDAWYDMDLTAEVQARTELPVSFARDTAAACVAELVAGRGHDLKSFLYIFVDTFVGGGLVIDSHLQTGVHGNAGAIASLPMQPGAANGTSRQLIDDASLWELEQAFVRAGLDPTAAYDERALRAAVPGPPRPGWQRAAGARARHHQRHGGARPGPCRDGRLDGARGLLRGAADTHACGAGRLQLGGPLASRAARRQGGGAGLRARRCDAAAARQLRAGPRRVPEGDLKTCGGGAHVQGVGRGGPDNAALSFGTRNP
jgi:hypothetical protein